MITLETVTSKHRDSFVKLLNNENVSKWLLAVPFPYLLKDADEFILKCEESKLSGKDHLFAIENDGIHIGGIGIHHKGEHKAEIGYWLGEEYWGNGYMTEALEKIVDFAFNELKYTRLFAGTFVGNTASGKVLVKCGFEFEGLLRKSLKKGDEFYDEKIFGRIS